MPTPPIEATHIILRHDEADLARRIAVVEERTIASVVRRAIRQYATQNGHA